MSMTKSGTDYNQLSLVLIPYPFTDLSSKKKRPALIVSNKKYNNKNKDLILCAVTSSPKKRYGHINLMQKDMKNGKLLKESKIKTNRIFTLAKELIIKKFGEIKEKKYKETFKSIMSHMERN